jgi:hypothetical protein
VSTAYGTVVLDIGSAARLRVPTAVSEVATPDLPAPPNPDALRCYRARLTSGTSPLPAPLGLGLEDAFGPLVVDLRAPTWLCFPADVSGQSPGAGGHPGRLACFQARTSKGHTPFSRVLGLYARNLFGTERLDASRLSEVCLPATVATP